MTDGFDTDFDVLTAVGGAGNAVFVIDASVTEEASTADRICSGCLEVGWRPLVLTVDEEATDHGYRPHEMSVEVTSTVVPGLMADRFHSGTPIHYLAVDANVANELVESLVATGIRPWIVRQRSSSSPPTGYLEVGDCGEFSWWIAAEHGHLAGGVATALGSASGPLPMSRRTLLTRIRGRSLVVARRLSGALPSPLTAPLVRKRHLALVKVNQEHLVDQAYLGRPPAHEVEWITPQGLPEVPPAGLHLGPLSQRDGDIVEEWLARGPYDSDGMLDRRMDNHGDELGRTIRALRTRRDLQRASNPPSSRGSDAGGSVLFDARCLQTPSFGTRGIGRFALAALSAVSAATPDSDLVLLIDRGLEVLPEDLAGGCEQITRVSSHEASRFAVLIQPSPMTADPGPLLPVLHSDAHKAAVVFDFIPAHYPTVYLSHPAARAEYAACLDALSTFDEFLCISHDTGREMTHWLETYSRSPDSYSTTVAWPEELDGGVEGGISSRTSTANSTGPIVLMTGDEGRKNTFGALAAIGVATAGPASARDVQVVGMPGHDVRVHHWSIAAGLRPGEAQTCDRLTDQELQELLASASAVVVASFDEGLSLPVIEAARSGAPVIASDIPTHRELIGAGSFLAPPGDIEALARAIRRHGGRSATHAQQRRHLENHTHESLEAAVTRVLDTRPGSRRTSRETVTPARLTGRRLSIGIATPWPPQPTGVADFSAATITELSRIADVTVYTTSGAEILDGIKQREVDELLNGTHHHDVLVSVVGNSHFHLPFVELLAIHECVVVAHDTRMVEFYMALRSKGGAEQVMLRGQAPKVISPNFDEQIDDMRLLQNAGLWEVARRAPKLILHSVSAAPRIARETGIEPLVLPFVNQRRPEADVVTEEMRSVARSRLGFSDDVINIATFGYVDIRTKLTDVVVEAAAWLTQWGHRVALHVVGSATPDQTRALTRRARVAALEEFTITGFTPEATYRDYLLGVDLGIQLRVSPLLGVSGPLSDLAAFGTPALASNGLCLDVAAPPFVRSLPDDVSSLMVAEAAEIVFQTPIDEHLREEQRARYLAGNTPEMYARELLGILSAVAKP